MPGALDILLPALAGLAGGGAGVYVGYFLTHRKSETEIDRLHMEAERFREQAEQIRNELERTRAETDRLRKEITRLPSTITRTMDDAAKRSGAGVPNDMLFDQNELDDADLEPFNARRVDNNGPVGEQGMGRFALTTDGQLRVVRLNTDGNYRIHIRRYWHRSRALPYIERRPEVPDKRYFLLTGEVRALEGTTAIQFVLRNPESRNDPVANDEKFSVQNQSWLPISRTFRVADAGFRLVLSLDHYVVGDQPSTVQYRNIRFVERSYAVQPGLGPM